MRRLHDQRSHVSPFARHNRKTGGHITLFGEEPPNPIKTCKRIVTAAAQNGPSKYAPSHAPALFMHDAQSTPTIRKGRY